jgi:hypothetical protein
MRRKNAMCEIEIDFIMSYYIDQYRILDKSEVER